MTKPSTSLLIKVTSQKWVQDLSVRTVEEYLEDPLAEKLLLNPNEGRRCLVTVEGDALRIMIDEEVFPLINQKGKKLDPRHRRYRKHVTFFRIGSDPPAVQVDVVYATPDNFIGRTLGCHPSLH